MSTPLPTIVVATRDRRERLLATLARLTGLPEQPPVVVVDNASRDGTAAAVRAAYPSVTVIVLPRDLGSAARTVGVEAAETPLVAFTDDDSWWEDGALTRAAAVFDAYPSLGLIAARIHVEPGGRLDPTCRQMAASPLEHDRPLPGPPVLGFVACAAVARRSAVLDCGGFHRRFGFGGEEELLAVDMAAAGWALAYVDDVVAHHAPTSARASRAKRELRNRLWSIWLRRPLPRAARLTAGVAASAPRFGIPALAEAVRGLTWVARERRVVPARLERSLRCLDDVPEPISAPTAG